MMIIKFNGGRGAVLCDCCKVIVMEDLLDYEMGALYKMDEMGEEWFCKKCLPEGQVDQGMRFIHAVDSFADLCSMDRRSYMRRKYGFIGEA